MNKIPPRAFQDACSPPILSEPHRQPGRGTAIRSIALAKALFPARSSITAATTAPCLVPVIASALAPALFPAPVRVQALVQGAVGVPVRFQVFAPVRVGAQESAVALAPYREILQKAQVPVYLFLPGLVTTLIFRVRTKRSLAYRPVPTGQSLGHALPRCPTPTQRANPQVTLMFSRLISTGPRLDRHRTKIKTKANPSPLWF